MADSGIRGSNQRMTIRSIGTARAKAAITLVNMTYKLTAGAGSTVELRPPESGDLSKDRRFRSRTNVAPSYGGRSTATNAAK